MIGDFIHRGARALSQREAHDEFLELCALSTSGELSEAEQKKLDQHLAVCPACRDALRQYESVIQEEIPSLAADETPENIDPGQGWSLKQAEKRFLDRLESQEHAKSELGGDRSGKNASGFPSRPLPVPSDSAWHHMWAVYAAGILLFIALSVFAYRVGIRRGSDMAKVAPTPPPVHAAVQDESALEAQLSDASHERQMARTQISQRDKTIADLRRELAQQAAQIKEMRAAQQELEAKAKVGTDSTNQTDLLERQAELTKKLETSETTSRSVQAKLDSLAQQSAQDAARAKAADIKVNELTQLLQQRESELEQQDQLLAHDRDIRELMGARDLYISEVYDVGDTGETRKPYGRIFYTHGKSLIFYAYDLDQQSGLKQASTFQAWGRRGPDPKQSVKLGIFYEDNSSKKRWVMKCDDPKTLAQIDGVFVTVEPNGASRRPSNKTLLFAYLKVNPNHP
jgi:hypothetical protein